MSPGSEDMLDARAAVGSHDILFVTLDTLRYDVAEAALAQGMTPALARLLPGGRWQRRHSPASFTYAAHHAFFAGFLPTPVGPGPHPRLFAARFAGSETMTDKTFAFEAADLPSGLADAGYHTLCIGGVGFFNKRNPLGCVLPSLFAESHWSEAMGVTSARSTELQVDAALAAVAAQPPGRRVFVFLNVSALHQPNCIFAGATVDSTETQAAALAYADGHLGRLVAGVRRRAPVLCIICSDHGTAYGDDGYVGHRLAHPCVWDVPYAEVILAQEGAP
jgi:hypothetical protein